MTGKTLTRPLTNAEKRLVERHHHLIGHVVKNSGFQVFDPAYDAYGECALALVLAAQRYMDNPALQKYKFSTIAWWKMRAALSNGVTSAARHPHALSLDKLDANGRSLYDFIPAEIAELNDWEEAAA